MKVCDKHTYQYDELLDPKCPECAAEENKAEVFAPIPVGEDFVARMEELGDEESANRMLLRELSIAGKKLIAKRRKLWDELAAMYKLDVANSLYYYNGKDKMLYKGVPPDVEDAR